jgi:integrase
MAARIPSYRLHRPSGQAVVTLDGRDRYLGKHNTPESQSEYERLISEWLAVRSNRAANVAPTTSLTVSEMIYAVWEQAKLHYRNPDGTPTGELENIKHALGPLRRMYGHTPAREFGPLALRAVRDEMVRAGLCRRTINARVNRIRRMFRWAASTELIPSSVCQGLATVPGLQRGRSQARETDGVKPVDWQTVDATLPFLPRPVKAMVQILRFSNCRAEDVVAIRACDICMDSEVWSYRPASHKNAWRGHDRVIHFGKQAQEVLQPFLKDDLDAYVFSPRDSLEQHHDERRALRKTKRTPSEARQKRQARPKWLPGSKYSVNTLQQAIRRACRRAGLPPWSVLQVRHSRATEVREWYGIEGAAASLGHRRVETSQIYAEKNERLSREIAREIG